jgi:flagellar biosynthetic protein FlhB
MPASTGEKTEQPTEKRLREARKKGQAARSQDLTSALLLIALVAIVWLIGEYIGGVLTGTVKDQIEFAATFKGQFTNETARNVIGQGLSGMVRVLTPIFAVVVVFAVLGNYLQTGTIFSFESIAPKFEKLNPAEGFRQTFLKWRPYVELGKTIFKMLIIALVVGLVLWTAREDIVRLIAKSPDVIAAYTFGLVLGIGLKIGLVLLVLGGADYFLQRFLLRQELKMTRHEVKEEYRETEGNPLIKAQRRVLHREILSQSLAMAVREADVVIEDPTRVAVALKYERGKSNAPVVTAKGADWMATKIREIADESGVPVKRDDSLARTLYKVEIEQEIPEKHFEAVAVVLQWVYSLRDEG